MALLTPTITYYRSTDFPLVANVTPPEGLTVVTGLFTVKTSQNDTDADDSTALLSKTVAASDDSCDFSIEPDDISDSTSPGTYYYSMHMVMSDGKIYPYAAGKFTLKATTTNREA